VGSSYGKEESLLNNHTWRMLETHPSGAGVDPSALVECIQRCFDCAHTCTACADACLSEGNVQMLGRCIRLNLDCADICNATGKVSSRQTAFDAGMVRTALEACARACRVCGDECEQHALDMEHCRVCAEACRRCESACNNLLASVGS
jgi:hypothetical protein